MPKYACFVLLAFGLLRPPSAAAEPLCLYVALTGTLVGVIPLVSSCVPYPDEVLCVTVAPGTPELRLVVVICRPAV
jgi:hypothetical protein